MVAPADGLPRLNPKVLLELVAGDPVRGTWMSTGIRRPRPWEPPTSTSILFMSVSADGYIADDERLPRRPGRQPAARVVRTRRRVRRGDRPGPGGDGRDGCRRRGRDRPAYGGADGPLGRQADGRRTDLRAEPPRARPGRPRWSYPERHLHRRHRQRHGAGEGRRRRPARPRPGRLHRAAGARSRACWTSCSSRRSRCCSAAAGGCSTYCPARSSSRRSRSSTRPEATHLRYRVKGGSPGRRSG